MMVIQIAMGVVLAVATLIVIFAGSCMVKEAEWADAPLVLAMLAFWSAIAAMTWVVLHAIF